MGYRDKLPPKPLVQFYAAAPVHILSAVDKRVLDLRRLRRQCPFVFFVNSDERSDSFLIMDVNPNRAPWVWVRSDDLIAAMRTFDTVENRGYHLVSEVE